MLSLSPPLYLAGSLKYVTSFKALEYTHTVAWHWWNLNSAGSNMMGDLDRVFLLHSYWYSSVPSRRQISRCDEFWPAAENPWKKCGHRKRHRILESWSAAEKIQPKFGWVEPYCNCINWLSFTCPHLLLQAMLNACSVLWDWNSG